MPSEPLSTEKRRVWIGSGVIAGVAAAAYADSFLGAFQFDDFPAIRDNNPTLLRLWPLPGPLWPPPGSLTVSGRPILNLSLALNHALSGFSPWSYHAGNLLIHVFAGLALFGILRRSLHSVNFALAGALVWTVHPLQTEAVTYIVQRAESLMALFYLLTLYAFIRSIPPAGPDRQDGFTPPWGRGAAEARQGRGWAALSVLACLLGMGTKEVMVSAPVAVFLYDRTFVAGSWRGTWRARKGYYLGLAATWIPLALLVASSGGNRGGTSGFNLGVYAPQYWFSQIEAVTRYLGLVFWPHPLVFEYGPPTFSPWLSILLFGPLLLAAGVATVLGVARGRPWAFCAACCWMILAPTSVMPGTIQFAVEYRMYLPLAAIIAALAGGAQAAAGRWPRLARVRPVVWQAALAILVLALGGATARRNWDYRSDLALWSDSVAKRPASAKAQSNLGMALSTRGRTAEAIACYQLGLRLNPGLAETHYNLGLSYESLNRREEALAEFLAAARLDPKFAYAQSAAGRLLNSFGRPAEAEPLLRRAVATEPKMALAHGSLGVALVALGRTGEAIAEFQESLRLDPAQADVEFDLAIALARNGQLEEAARHNSNSVRLQPGNADAQLNLGVTLLQLGRAESALPPLREAARLEPDSATAHGNLAAALDAAGQGNEALREFRRALELKPDYPEAHYNLGNALLRGRRLEAARAEFAEALRLDPNLAAAREMLDRLSQLPAGP
jgi:tetratricopeptide (TPR) repeat protein